MVFSEEYNHHSPEGSDLVKRAQSEKNRRSSNIGDQTDNMVETSTKIVEDGTWYSGMLSSFLGATACEEDRNASETRVDAPVDLVMCGVRRYSRGLAASSDNDDIVRVDGNEDESREDVDNDSLASESVSTLGRGLGDDLKSLPSVQGGILPCEDESITSLDTFSIPNNKDNPSSPKTGLPLIGALSNKKEKETVESVVEKKINNLKSERGPRESEKIVPFLRRKMFPKTSGRSEDRESESSQTPDSILETRRQLLVAELRHAVDKFGRFDTRCANITAALGDLYDENKEFQQALKLHKDAVSVYSIKLGDDSEVYLDAKLRLGEVQENSGQYDEAIATFYEVMSMTKALKGESDPSSADVLTRVAVALRKKGRFELATKTLKRALKIYRDLLGDSHPSVSSTVDAIASLYVTVGDFTKASAILEEVVKLKAATMGAGSKDVAASLSELATCYECAEQYSKAMKNLKKAYKIYAEISGETGERSILTLERIALIYQATGQFKKAAIAYLGVLRGRKRALGDSHPTVADTYFHLGVSLRESGQQEKAFKCMKQALNIYVGEGKDMHDVEMIAEVMHELAIIHKTNNNMAEAIKTFKQEVAVRRKLGQPEYPLIAQTLNHLGVAEFEIKNHNRALNYFMETLTIYESRGDDLGTDFAEVLYNTGLVFESIRNKQRAYDAFLEAARIFKANGYSDDHPHLSKAANKLRRMGHTCKCKDKPCTSIPCNSLVVYRQEI